MRILEHMKRIILASQSPRRRELLDKIVAEFDIFPSNFDEQLDESRPTHEVAIELALGKARDIAMQHPDACVIGADTIVTLDSKQLAKPVDTDDAIAMLKLLRGRTHDVITGVAVITDGREYAQADTTRLTFSDYTDQQITDYVATGDPMDKAGGYGIQSMPPEMVVHIDGDRNNVIGLPVDTTRRLLRDVGVV